MSHKDFEFQHPAGLRIHRHLREAELTAALPQTAAAPMGADWAAYQLPPFKDGQTVVGCRLHFQSGALKSVDLWDAADRHGTSWNDWSEHKERQRAESIRGWLRAQGYRGGRAISIGYDPKNGSGEATVNYD